MRKSAHTLISLLLSEHKYKHELETSGVLCGLVFRPVNELLSVACCSSYLSVSGTCLVTASEQPSLSQSYAALKTYMTIFGIWLSYCSVLAFSQLRRIKGTVHAEMKICHRLPQISLLKRLSLCIRWNSRSVLIFITTETLSEYLQSQVSLIVFYLLIYLDRK